MRTLYKMPQLTETSRLCSLKTTINSQTKPNLVPKKVIWALRASRKFNKVLFEEISITLVLLLLQETEFKDSLVTVYFLLINGPHMTLISWTVNCGKLLHSYSTNISLLMLHIHKSCPFLYSESLYTKWLILLLKYTIN